MITVDTHTSGAWIASSAPTPMEVPVQSSRPLGWQEMPEYAHMLRENRQKVTGSHGPGSPKKRYPATQCLEMFREFTLW